MQYFLCGDIFIAINAKCATNSICAALVKKYLPRIYDTLDGSNEFVFREYARQTDIPNNDIAMFFRDPLDRFLSAVAMNNTDIDETLNSLLNRIGWQYSDHIFEKQIDFIKEGNGQKVKCFIFPTQIEEFCKHTGLQYPLPTLNETRNDKPTLSKTQFEKFKIHFKEDIEFFEILKQGKINDGQKILKSITRH